MALDEREFQQFVTQAQMKLTGASEAGIKAELYDVIKEFLTDSNSWAEDITFIPKAGQTEYPLAPKTEGQILRLVAVWNAQSTPVDASMVDFAKVVLRWPPQNDGDAGHKWTARIAKTLTLPTTKTAIPIAPSWVLGVHSVHILDGLLGKMMAQQQKTYSNPTLSAYHLKRFRQGIQIARTAAARANLFGGQTWNYPRGWRSGSQRGGVGTWPVETA